MLTTVRPHVQHTSPTERLPPCRSNAACFPWSVYRKESVVCSIALEDGLAVVFCVLLFLLLPVVLLPCGVSCVWCAVLKPSTGGGPSIICTPTN